MAAPAHSPTQPPTAYNRWEAGWESGPVPPPKSLFRDFPKTGLSAVRAGPALPRMPAGYARNRNSAFERSGGASYPEVQASPVMDDTKYRASEGIKNGRETGREKGCE